MTNIPILDIVPREQIVATAGQTEIDFPFLITAANQLTLLRTDAAGVVTTLALNVDYLIPSTSINEQGGGTLILTEGGFPTGATAGDVFTMIREVPIERLAQFVFPNRGRFRAATVNSVLATIFLILQELSRDSSRTFRLGPADALESIELPEGREGRFLAFDASGVPIAAAGTSGDLDPVSAYIATLLDDANASAARETLAAQEDVITTRGDLVVGNSSAAAARLPRGSNGQVLKMAGDDPAWGAVALPAGYFGPVHVANATDIERDITLSWTGRGDTQEVTLSSVTKRIDATYSFGTGNGGLFSGSVVADTVYYLIAISRDSDGASGWGFDTDPAGTNVPSGFTFEAMLGAIVTNGSSNIINDRFMIVQPDGSQAWRSEGLTAPSSGPGSLIETGITKEIVRVSVSLECTTAEQGYLVGDRVHIDHMGGNNSSALGVIQEGTEIRLITSDTGTPGLTIPNKTNGARSSATEANWSVFILADTAP